MPSIDRPLSGDALLFDLEEEREKASEPSILERSGRNARTLVKSGPLRVVLVALAPGGGMAEHQSEGPITVQPVKGRIRLVAGDREFDLQPGEILSLDGGISHHVTSEDGGAFLLTVVHPEGA